MNKSYLGQKGYTIIKEHLTIHEEQHIRSDLMVKPYIPNSPIKLPEFAIYRESRNKIYVPRYFGEEHYGEPDENMLKEPQPINLQFSGELRDYQEKIVNTFLKKSNDGGGLLEIPCGRGKNSDGIKNFSRIKSQNTSHRSQGLLIKSVG